MLSVSQSQRIVVVCVLGLCELRVPLFFVFSSLSSEVTDCRVIALGFCFVFVFSVSVLSPPLQMRKCIDAVECCTSSLRLFYNFLQQLNEIFVDFYCS